jgi:hypothetical protein
MLAKTIPITRIAVQFERGRAGLAGVFELEGCSPPSIIRPSLRGGELDAQTDGIHRKEPRGFIQRLARAFTLSPAGSRNGKG